MTDRPNRALQELIDWIRIPSHVAEPQAMLEGAGFCAGLLKEAGFRVTQAGPAEAPAIIATLNPEAEHRLVFYSHYDVVAPGDPKDWAQPPFSGHVADGVLYGRGSSDHKATFIARLEAIRRLQARGELPLGITFFVEGDEELGSKSLEGIILENRDALRASGGLYSGGARDENGRPVIRAGCKGRVGLRLTVRYADRHHHSKLAAVLPNPSWRLVAALACLYDGKADRLLIPGYSDTALPPDAADEEALRRIDFDEASFLEATGHKALRGDAQADPLRALMFNPTFSIAWLRSGTGGATVLPGEAEAMIDLRLVPGQTPDKARRIVRAHLDACGFADVGLTSSGGSETDKCDLTDPVVQSLAAAAAAVHGECVVHPMGAGSGPRWMFQKHLGYSLIQDPGCSWAGSNDHAANENIQIRHFEQNIDLVEAFLKDYAQRCGASHA